jgi:hypothetical protein
MILHSRWTRPADADACVDAAALSASHSWCVRSGCLFCPLSPFLECLVPGAGLGLLVVGVALGAPSLFSVGVGEMR